MERQRGQAPVLPLARVTMKLPLVFIVMSSFLFACAPNLQTPANRETVSIYATSATQPWLSDAFTCANELSMILKVNSSTPDVYIRLDEPKPLLMPAYQIDEEEILIVAHPESPLQGLSPDQVQALFAGQGDPSVQVWTYTADEDVQIAFDRLVLKGKTVTPRAMLAVDPLQMAEGLTAQSNAVGILTRHWKTDAVRELYSAGIVPVLAITQTEPSGNIQQLIACLQE